MGRWSGARAYPRGQDKDLLGRLGEDSKECPASSSKAGVKQHGRPADGSDGPRTGRKLSSLKVMTRRAFEGQRDAG